MFMAGGAMLCALAAVVLLLQPQIELQALHRSLAAGCVVACGVFGWFSRPSAPLDLRDRVMLASLIGMGLVVTLAWHLGTGLRTVALGILPLLVGLAVLLAGGWRALLVTGVALASIALLAWHDAEVGRDAIITAWSRLTPASGVWSHLMMLMGGLVFGLVARSLVQRWTALAEAREAQFRELLASAADRYVELDAELRFTHPSLDLALPAGPVPTYFIGRHPWDTPGLQFDPGQAAQHREQLLARQPFDIELTSQPDPQAPPERLALSGRPRWSSHGQFLGYWCVGRNITAQERQREAAEQAAADASAANRAKSSFLANMSHEIRTPLNGILGLARLARDSVDQRQRLVEYLDLIGDSAEALHTTLTNVLDLSRAEAGRLDVLPEVFDLHALLHDVHRSSAALARAAGLGCTLQVDPGVPQHLRADAVRLRQILTNYLHNALKFTREGGIGLSARLLDGADPARLRLEVHDTGCGIAAADQALLFQPFSQVDASAQRQQGGSGLGLSICRELARALGGEVGLSSSAGQGSRFWLDLPVPTTTVPATVSAPVSSMGPAPASPPVSAPAQPAHSLPPLRVLVAEDNPVNMMITVALLDSWGLRVTQSVNGRAAVDAALQAHAAGQPFDVVLMDLQMPVLDGLAATREIRALGLRTPVVALTATVVERDWADGLAAGLHEVLAKPVDSQRLHAVLSQLTPATR